jgi:hypothetical protein
MADSFSLPSLPDLSKYLPSLDGVKQVADTVLTGVMAQNPISGKSIFGISGTQILAIVLGLICVIIGLLMFRPVMEVAKTAAVAA